MKGSKDTESETLKKENAKNKSENSKMELRIKELEGEATNWKRRCLSVIDRQTDIDKTRKSVTAERDSFAEKIIKLETRLSVKETQIKNLSLEKRDLKNKLKELESEAKELRSLNEDLSNTKLGLQLEVERLSREVERTETPDPQPLVAER